jgi:hypothetical protein
VGQSKRQLLKQHVLPQLAACRAEQRLVAEFADLAAVLEEDSNT